MVTSVRRNGYVVDGSDEAPEEQLTAVREVLAEIGAQDVPELVVINKADLADPVVLARVQRREPHSVVVSARTGAGIEELLRRIDDDLPHAAVAIDLVVPYSRGDLVARAHREGELDTVEHVETGTRLIGRVNEALAAELESATA